MPMHGDEIACDIGTARQLILAQFPQGAGLEVKAVPSDGTDNRMFRLGEKLALRVPRRRSAVPLLEKELAWLPKFGGLPLSIPKPRAAGLASDRFPHPFAVVPWLEGRSADQGALADAVCAARSLAGFLQALQRQASGGAPLAGTANHFRGVPLAQMEARSRRAIADCADELDSRAAIALSYYRGGRNEALCRTCRATLASLGLR